MSILSAIRIVLVEPAGALNVGSIARIMKNMGLQQLVLVDPHCDPLGAEARQMAVHAIDILEAAICVETIPDALQGCDRAIATTGRDQAIESVLESPRQSLPWLLQVRSPHQAALIFGPEDRGLNNAELHYAQRLLRIPSSPNYPSLNLAQAVAVCCYELYLMAIDPQLPAPETAERAAIESIEAFYDQLETVLLQIGYLYPHTAQSRMEKFRRLFNRSQLSAAEVAMLRGILRQMAWFVSRDQSPDDSR
ncbi:RNA methyltransferase [Microcoleus sp. FACHB-1515]|uniref:RNA methyltransferase n=1 Tax=Cyanophyceae TaxID=3028117 RepID=UPI0016842A46|nr:RNA methyltransferase [Microcoleus sp. FACHB-1515]MBD2090236.1 RNA methyltransferase [Microcoleus sp. FACHB-1515]